MIAINACKYSGRWSAGPECPLTVADRHCTPIAPPNRQPFFRHSYGERFFPWGVSTNRGNINPWPDVSQKISSDLAGIAFQQTILPAFRRSGFVAVGDQIPIASRMSLLGSVWINPRHSARVSGKMAGNER